jgi:hypothetical protein
LLSHFDIKPTRSVLFEEINITSEGILTLENHRRQPGVKIIAISYQENRFTPLAVKLLSTNRRV